jgi:SAM-dependent methyltransferase
MGIDDLVKVVEYDFTDPTVFSVMPHIGTADIITMSYSFSMIPNQKAAMDNAVKLLKPNGLLAIADFFRRGNHDDALPFVSKTLRTMESFFHMVWFACDHVYLLRDETMDELTPSELEVVWDKRFRGGVPFLPFLRPFHGVYILKKTVKA